MAGCKWPMTIVFVFLSNASFISSSPWMNVRSP